jgi:hypothetical protein
MPKLIRELYDCALKDDPLFHFFYEPELIIRIGSEHCLQRVRLFLNERNVAFEEYDYPSPKTVKGFGEEKGGVVAEHLDLFLPVFHAHSVAAITMDDPTHTQYLERVIHTAFNPKRRSREHEGTTLLTLAKMKLHGLSPQDISPNARDAPRGTPPACRPKPWRRPKQEPRGTWTQRTSSHPAEAGSPAKGGEAQAPRRKTV